MSCDHGAAVYISFLLIWSCYNDRLYFPVSIAILGLLLIDVKEFFDL